MRELVFLEERQVHAGEPCPNRPTVNVGDGACRICPLTGENGNQRRCLVLPRGESLRQEHLWQQYDATENTRFILRLAAAIERRYAVRVLGNLDPEQRYRVFQLVHPQWPKEEETIYGHFLAIGTSGRFAPMLGLEYDVYAHYLLGASEDQILEWVGRIGNLPVRQKQDEHAARRSIVLDILSQLWQDKVLEWKNEVPAGTHVLGTPLLAQMHQSNWEFWFPNGSETRPAVVIGTDAVLHLILDPDDPQSPTRQAIDLWEVFQGGASLQQLANMIESFICCPVVELCVGDPFSQENQLTVIGLNIHGQPLTPLVKSKTRVPNSLQALLRFSFDGGRLGEICLLRQGKPAIAGMVIDPRRESTLYAALEGIRNLALRYNYQNIALWSAGVEDDLFYQIARAWRKQSSGNLRVKIYTPKSLE